MTYYQVFCRKPHSVHHPAAIDSPRQLKWNKTLVVGHLPQVCTERNIVGTEPMKCRQSVVTGTYKTLRNHSKLIINHSRAGH